MGTKIHYTKDDLLLTVGGKDYSVSVKVTADYWYQPCVMYFKDGSGQPEDEGWDVEEVKAVWKLDGVAVKPTEEMNEALDDYISEMICNYLNEHSQKNL